MFIHHEKLFLREVRFGDVLKLLSNFLMYIKALSKHYVSICSKCWTEKKNPSVCCMIVQITWYAWKDLQEISKISNRFSLEKPDVGQISLFCIMIFGLSTLWGKKNLYHNTFPVKTECFSTPTEFLFLFNWVFDLC